MVALKTNWTRVGSLLKEHFGKPHLTETDLFMLLIKTILSQNTTDTNSSEAFRRLEGRFEITPRRLAKADVGAIKECIEVAGLGNVRAQRLKEVSRMVEEKFAGDLHPLYELPLEEGRAMLLEIPGVGEKSADVVLALGARQPTVPVDTHLFTIARRLSLTGSRRYREVREAYERLIPPRERAMGHLLFIQLGKEICTARSPKCPLCPLRDLCPKIGVESPRLNRPSLSRKG